MAFSYYNRLTPKQKRIYRESDKVSSIRLPGNVLLSHSVKRIGRALKSENRIKVEKASQELAHALMVGLKLSPVKVIVLSKRPSRTWGELHGLYEPKEGRGRPKITVWMRTAQRRQVVAFRTYLRTLLHEFGHHLDYELLKLADSFHTEGFYKRESSLVHQLLRDINPGGG